MKLLIIGPTAFPVSFELAKNFAYSMDAFSMLIVGLRHSFEKLEVDVTTLPITYDKEFPEADFVILVIYEGSADELFIAKLRQQTKCIKIISLRETPSNLVDYGFVFIEKWVNETNSPIHLPANKELLKPTPKTPKTVLLDHYWEKLLNTDKDWTFRIENWIEKLVGEGFVFYRMLRFPNEEKTIKSFEIPIEYTNYLNYLEKTKDIETYIITHQESYAYGVIDMACRGTRVCTPPTFLKPVITDRLGIPIFTNEQELLSILRAPIEDYWKDSALKCTDYDEIALIVYNKLKEWEK